MPHRAPPHRDTATAAVSQLRAAPRQHTGPSWAGEGLCSLLLEARSLRACAAPVGFQPCPRTCGTALCVPPRGSRMAAVPGVNEVSPLQMAAVPVSARGAQICSLLVRSAGFLCGAGKGHGSLESAGCTAVPFIPESLNATYLSSLGQQIKACGIKWTIISDARSGGSVQIFI